MNTSEVIRNRHSVRKYKKGVQIPRKDIETMLEAEFEGYGKKEFIKAFSELEYI